MFFTVQNVIFVIYFLLQTGLDPMIVLFAVNFLVCSSLYFNCILTFDINSLRKPSDLRRTINIFFALFMCIFNEKVLDHKNILVIL